MKRMKTFFKYALWIVLFFIFSEIMINLNLESTYREMGKKSNLEQVSVYQAESTKVNGRMKGTITNKPKIDKKYLRLDLYSARNVLLGSKYIDISDMNDGETRDFETYFKVQDVDYYDMEFTDEKPEGSINFPELFKDATKSEMFWWVFISYLVLF